MQEQLRALHINAAFEPSGGDAEGQGGSPATQLAHLLAFPLTHDQPAAADAGPAQAGGSPANADGPAAAAQQQRQQQQQQQQHGVQGQLLVLHREARDLRESLALAEARAAAFAEEAQLLRGQAAAAEERQAAAEAWQAQAAAVLAAAAREKETLQAQVEAAAAQRWESQQREADLLERLELLALERGEAAAAAAADGDGALLATAAELAAGVGGVGQGLGAAAPVKALGCPHRWRRSRSGARSHTRPPDWPAMPPPDPCRQRTDG